MTITIEIDKRSLVGAFECLDMDEVRHVITEVVDNVQCLELDEMLLVKMWKNILTEYGADEAPSFGDIVRRYKDIV